MQINLRIENLVLQDLPLSPADQAELMSSLQLELGRLLTTESNSLPWKTLNNQDYLQAPSIHYQPGTDPSHLGRELAASLFGRLQSQNYASQTSDKT
jgi:hypothetical protein